MSFTRCGLCDVKKIAHVNHIEGSPESLDKIDRYVVISSVVNWKDTESENDGTFVVVLTGYAKGMNSCLRGRIHLFPYEKTNNNEDWIDIQDKLYDIDRCGKSEGKDNLAQKFTSIEDSLLKFDDDEFFVVSYSLNQTGIVLLKYIVTKSHENEYLHMLTATRKCYYYLKYSLHIHKHHNSIDDSITTVHKVPYDINNIGLLLLNDLKRSLIYLNRKFDNHGNVYLYKCQGIASYALSLAESCKKVDLISDDNYKAEVNYFNNIKNSLEFSAKSEEKQTSNKVVASNIARSTILFLFSVITPVLILYKDHILPVIDNQQAVPLETNYGFFVTLIKNIFSSDSGIVFFILLILLSYWSMNAIISKYGTYYFALKKSLRFLRNILGDMRSAVIFAIVVMVIGLGLVAGAIINVYYT
ncbi:MAG: hypothetical protein AB2653_06380 [Candidatus Thiodiazotropha endolucinida]